MATEIIAEYMDAIEILGIIVAVVLLVALGIGFVMFVTLGILYDENPERAEELMRRWFDELAKADNERDAM